MEYLKKQRNPQGFGQVFLAFGDLGCLIVAICFIARSGLWNSADRAPLPIGDLSQFWSNLISSLSLFLALMVHSGVYSKFLVLRWRECVRRIFRVVLIWGGISGLLGILLIGSAFSVVCVCVQGILLFFLLLLWRVLVQKKLFGTIDGVRSRLLVIGSGEDTDEMVSVFSEEEKEPYLLCGLIRTSPGEFASEETDTRCPVYDGLEMLELAAMETRAQSVIILDPELSREDILRASEYCIRKNIDFKLRTTAFEILSSLLSVEMVGGTPVLARKEVRANQVFYRILKRCMDLSIALPTFILASPIMAIFALIVHREDAGPVLFKQNRVGKYGETFSMWKLRSMKLGSEAVDRQFRSTSADDARLLNVGRLMRRWSIDELPQLWNVIAGNMSLVGPRPERQFHAENLAQEITHYGFRHLVKPGMTGWAQVNGLKGDCDFSERAKFDLYYIENWSSLLDLQILAITAFKLKDEAF